jgi:hypothetical protein
MEKREIATALIRIAKKLLSEEIEDKKVVKAQMFVFFPSRMEASRILKNKPTRNSAAEDWDYYLIEYDDKSQEVYHSITSGWKPFKGGDNTIGLEFVKEGALDYSGDRAKFKSLAK